MRRKLTFEKELNLTKINKYLGSFQDLIHFKKRQKLDFGDEFDLTKKVNNLTCPKARLILKGDENSILSFHLEMNLQRILDSHLVFFLSSPKFSQDVLVFL